MSHLRYITHPEVVIDPAIPVGRWGLNELGASRARAMLAQPWVSRIGRVVCSHETKAMETAAILGQHVGVEVEVRSNTGENDRTATGFLPPTEFNRVADAFFAASDQSIRGWERMTAASQASSSPTEIVGTCVPQRYTSPHNFGETAVVQNRSAFSGGDQASMRDEQYRASQVTIADELEIRRLLAKYCQLIDDGRVDDWLDLFTEDAEYLVMGLHLTGR